MQAYFSRQVVEVGRAVRANPLAASRLTLSHWTAPMTEAVLPLMEAMAWRGVRDFALTQRLRIRAPARRSFSAHWLVKRNRDRNPFGNLHVQSDQVLQFVRDMTFNFLDAANRTSSERLRAALLEYLGDPTGYQPRELAQKIDGIFRDPTRAAAIATTECLPGDAVICGANVLGAYRRWYVGPMFEVVTEDGLKLTGTPNHPVLTTRGWVSFSQLQKSDRLVSDGDWIKGATFAGVTHPGNVNVEAPPTSLGKIFDSLSAVGVLSRVRTGKPDFHGDGLEGYVDVSDSNRTLRYGRLATSEQLLENLFLAPSDQVSIGLVSDGEMFKLRSSVSKSYGVDVSPHDDAATLQECDNWPPPDAMLLADLTSAHSRGVFGHDRLRDDGALGLLVSSRHLGSGRLRESPSGHSEFFADFENCRVVASHDFRDRATAAACPVKLSCVSSLVRIENWFGHVYNLATSDGYYNANGLYTKNSSRATHGGQVVAAKESQVVSEKIWLASGDACFAAGSLVLKYSDGMVCQVGIETLAPGDMVIGGSGRPRKVLAVRAKLHQGDIVHGRGFSVTPDHRFLTSDGWRPIGEYAFQAEAGRDFDLAVSEAKHVPAALLKVLRLPAIFPGNRGPTVPVHAVAQDDEFPIVDDKIDNPLLVHGNLLAERDAVLSQERRHRDFDVGPFGLSGMVVDHGAVSGAVVGLPPTLAADPARVLVEELAAPRTDASHFLFLHGVGRAAHQETVNFASAGKRAESSPGLLGSFPFGHKGFAASLARLLQEPLDLWVLRKRSVLATTTAKRRPPLNASGRDFVRLAAESTRSRSVAAPGRAEAFLTAKLPEMASGTTVGCVADHTRRCLDRDSGFRVTGVAAKATGAFDRRLGPEKCSASHAYNVIHDDVVGSQLTLASSFRGLVYDIQVEQDECFVLACGLIAHNCDLCLQLDGSAVRLDDAYVTIGKGPYARIMHPPAHVWCQCAQQYE